MSLKAMRRRYSGTIASIHDTVGERGIEYFSVSVAPNGHRTLQATGEIYDRKVSKDIVYTVDERWRPVDCYTRLQKDGVYFGDGWFRFTDTGAAFEGYNTGLGRVSQHIALNQRPQSFGPHPLSGDALHCATFDHASGVNPQPTRGSLLNSLEHDGCSGPMIHPIDFRIEFVGPERITVRAGTFETHHYRFLVEGSLPKEHPTEELWVTPDDFVMVKIRVGGYLATTYELIQFQNA